jgi:uncharacterized protein involved in exopolysaccharide biosynthesis
MEKENLPIIGPRNSQALSYGSEASLTPEFEEGPASSGLDVNDILFMLFRHRWKILFCVLVGSILAGAIYFLVPPVYESEAKLLVRYVMERSAVDGLENQIKTPTPENRTLINSELEILTSTDLIRQVAESVGVNRFTSDRTPGATDKAIEAIDRALEVGVIKDTNIISVGFKSSNPNLPMPVVQELVKRYFDRHLAVHRSTGAFEFVRKETAELKNQLAQTETELKELRESTGIISLTEAKSDIAIELGKTQQELDGAVADFASQQARVKDLQQSLALSPGEATTTAQPISGDTLEKYKSLVARLTELQKAENELLLKYTPENPIVKVKAAQVAELEGQRSGLEKQYPALVSSALATTVTGQAAQPNIASERAILAGLQSKLDALRTRMTGLQERATKISDAGPRIEELERKQQIEETNYRASEASLEKAQIDETLDPSRMPNISIVQAPSPATRAKRNVGKVIIGIAGGSLAIGIAVTLLIELLLDQSIKRSVEVEKRLRIPLLLTIPYLETTSRRLRLRDASDVANPEARSELQLVEGGDELLKPFCASIRDRLGLFFAVNKIEYKPKLVAVTGLGRNAGASTLATGLFDALSENPETKVRLVDQAISPKNLYDMLSEFKESDLDYVIFDLPSLGDTSSTLPLARFMDTVLLVVEAGKSNRNAVKRTYAQLAAKTNVSVIFNKSRSYGPKWLEGDL